MSTAPTRANHDTIGSRDGITWLAYFFLGVCFGITLTQSEILSWFRIQEMFRFQSPRMYEIMASAICGCRRFDRVNQAAWGEDHLGRADHDSAQEHGNGRPLRGGWPALLPCLC